MKTRDTSTWYEQEMKLCLKFNYHYSKKKKEVKKKNFYIPDAHFQRAFDLHPLDALLSI